MRSPGIKPASIALFPTAADRSTLSSAHQHYYLSPPLTPYPRVTPYNEQSDRTSPVTSSYQPSLPALQEMLPHETGQRKSSVDTQTHNQHSAPSTHSERDIKETVEHRSPSKYQVGQHPTDPVRLMPLYSTQPHNAVSQPPSVVPPLLRRNKAHVASACVNCKKAHLACDGNDPHAFSPSVYLWISIFFYSPYFLFFFAPGIPTICRFATECGCQAPQEFGFLFSFLHVIPSLFLLFIFLCGSKFGTASRGMVRSRGEGIFDCSASRLNFWARSCFQKMSYPAAIIQSRGLPCHAGQVSLNLTQSLSKPILFSENIPAALLFSVGLCADSLF